MVTTVLVATLCLSGFLSLDAMGTTCRIECTMKQDQVDSLEAGPVTSGTASADWITAAMREKLSAAGENGEAITTLLDAISDTDQRRSVRFLIENMQPEEFSRIDATDFVEDVALACQARRDMPWGSEIPDEIFLNDVLPGFHVDEPREHWRPVLYEHAREIVDGCTTPAEAAQRLNEQLFARLEVKYSTARRRANQSPGESIEQGLASCTGLSILLADACRSVCVPARLTGIPSWPNKRGNHTWVEVWDGEWHFTGAAEPSDQGLNHTWFQADAGLAVKDSEMNAIYAISFKPTDTEFPAVWSDRSGAKIYAVNVTDRYAPPAEGEQDATQTADAIQTRIRIWNRGRSQRIETGVTIVPAFAEDDARDNTQSGRSTGNEADMNNLLSFDLNPLSHYRLKVETAGGIMVYPVRTNLVDGEETQLIEIELPAPSGEPLSDEDAEKLRTAVDQYFSVLADERKHDGFAPELDQLLASHPGAARQLVWEQWLASPAAAIRKDDFDRNQVTFDEHTSPYTLKEVGARPDGGWPLVIAMHGGGGAPKEVNDSQWEHMQIYYKDHAEIGGYKYLALRAPNDSWNGFYDDYVYPLIENLISQMTVHGDVDPNRVFIMGYSHGGYGAFAIGPKIPYRFAAIHSSAAAPTDGQISARTLRNTRFTFMVGENDTAFGRRERCDKFAEQIAELQSAASNGTEYPVEFLFKPGYGHGGLPDRDIIPELYDYNRNTTPLHLTWEQTDTVVNRHFWLTDENPVPGKVIDAQINGNRIVVNAKTSGEIGGGFDGIAIQVDHRLIDSSIPVEVEFNGKVRSVESNPSLQHLCESVENTCDIELSFDRQITGD